jgi:hypothetical protein
LLRHRPHRGIIAFLIALLAFSPVLSATEHYGQVGLQASPARSHGYRTQDKVSRRPIRAVHRFADRRHLTIKIEMRGRAFARGSLGPGAAAVWEPDPVVRGDLGSPPVSQAATAGICASDQRHDSDWGRAQSPPPSWSDSARWRRRRRNRLPRCRRRRDRLRPRNQPTPPPTTRLSSTARNRAARRAQFAPSATTAAVPRALQSAVRCAVEQLGVGRQELFDDRTATNAELLQRT